MDNPFKYNMTQHSDSDHKHRTLIRFEHTQIAFISQLHSNFKSVPFFMKNTNISIVYLFYKVFIVSKVKVALIDCGWLKAPTKAA